jgi:hypothetical protein
MTTTAQEPLQTVPEKRRWLARLDVHEMWVALAIAVIWLAVLFDAILGPDIVSTSATTSTTVPSAVLVAFFAWLATRAVAKYGFRHGGDKDEP